VDAAKIQLNPRFIVDEAGKCQEVVLALAEYRELLELLEDHSDTLELDAAIACAKGFTPLEDVVADLRRDGLL
jgi:hypothetical protein